MAGGLKLPSGYKTTSTEQKLQTGPADMPNRGGAGVTPMGNHNERVNLTRTETPVAAFGAKPGQGKVMPDQNATVKLTPNPANPYAPISKTKPQVGGK